MANHEQIMLNEPASNLATKYLDTYGVTVGSTLLLREYTVIGGSTPTALADVVTADPASNAPGITVRDVNASAIAGFLGSTLSVQLKAGTIAVSLDPGHTLGSISNTGFNVTGQSATLNVSLDPGHTLGIVDSINKTVNVQFDPGHTLGAITNTGFTVTGQSATLNVALDPGHTLGKVEPGAGTFQVFLPDTGHEIGTIRGNTNTLTVFLPDTGHTLGKVDAGAGTFNVQLDPGHTIGKVDQGAKGASSWLTDIQSTASIFTVSGSTSGVSVSGVSLVAPSASYNYKIFAYSVQTTGLVSMTAKFTNGSGTSPTEFFRPLVTPASTTSIPIGANFSVMPPGYLFATGNNTTLALVLDTSTLVHYSVSYIKETA